LFIYCSSESCASPIDSVDASETIWVSTKLAFLAAPAPSSCGQYAAHRWVPEDILCLGVVHLPAKLGSSFQDLLAYSELLVLLSERLVLVSEADDDPDNFGVDLSSLGCTQVMQNCEVALTTRDSCGGYGGVSELNYAL
jgi:hypothetical protein